MRGPAVGAPTESAPDRPSTALQRWNRHDRLTPNFSAIALVVIFAGGLLVTDAAQLGAPVHVIDGSFVREWLVLGPFPSRDLEPDFLSDVGGEANVRPKEGDSVLTKEGRKLVWTRLKSDRDVVDLEDALGSVQWSVVYVYCELSSAESAATDAHAATLPQAAVWVNGAAIGRTSPRERLYSTPFLPIHLNAGRNPCLFKLRFEVEPPFGFAFQPLPPGRATVALQVKNRDGRPVRGAMIEFFDQGELVTRLPTDIFGKADVSLNPLAPSYDVSITSQEMGAWLTAVSLRPGEHRRFDVALQNAVSVSGKVLAMDRSPQAAIVVQAIRVSEDQFAGSSGRPSGSRHNALSSGPLINPNSSGQPNRPMDLASSTEAVKSLLPTPAFSKTVLSETNGSFQFVNLLPGRYRLRAHGARGFIDPEGGKTSVPSQTIVVGPGRTNQDITFDFAEAKKGVWSSVRIKTGLKDLNTTAVHRTAEGMLWVGTSDRALYAYDGVEFKSYAPPELVGNYVIAITHDASGAVWVATDTGINRIVNGRIQNFPSSDSLPGKVVNSVQADPDGGVWFSTFAGLFKYNGRQLSRWTVSEGAPSNGFGALLRAREGGLWMSTRGSLTRFDGKRFSQPVLLNGLRSAHRESLYQARDGALWFCSPEYENAAYRYDGKTLSRLGAEEGLMSDVLWRVVETSDGVLWIGSRKSISRFDGTTILNYTVADGLGIGEVRDIFVDSDDVIWCVTDHEISRFDPKSFANIRRRDGLTDTNEGTPGVFAIEPDGKDAYWIGTEWQGLHRLETRSGDRLVRTEIAAEKYVRHIRRAVDDGLWLGTSDGIYKYAGQRLQKVLERNWNIAFNTDDQGQLWFGQGWIGGGCSRYNPKTGEITSFTRAEGLPEESVWAIEPTPGGGAWIGTSGGLARFENGKMEEAGKRLRLPFAGVMALHRDDDGALWVGGEKGLYRLQGSQFVSVTPTNAGPVEGVWCWTRTPDGILWIGTDKHGLLGCDGQILSQIDTRDGLVADAVFTMRPDADGSLLIGAVSGGLGRYRRTKSAPSVRFVSVKMEDQTFSEFGRLPTTEIRKRISVQYQEIDLKTHPDKRQFRYRVEGPAGELLFGGVTKSRQFDWTPKTGGTYTFQVQAIDRDLNYSKPARLTLRATVPWYANAWITVPGAAGICVLLLFSVLTGWRYLVHRREVGRLQERARIARDLHDNLGAGLTHLALLGDFVREQSDQPGSARDLATRLSESAHELTRTMGEVIWTTDPAKDTLQSLVSFVSTYAERFFSASSVRLRLNFPTEIPDILLPAGVRHSVFMVVKEALNNVAKHARASEVRINVELQDRQLRLSVEDDGKGFQRAEGPVNRNGLTNMEKRLRELGGEFQIESEVGHGTRVYARLRLPK